MIVSFLVVLGGMGWLAGRAVTGKKKNEVRPFFGDKVGDFCVNKTCVAMIDGRWMVEENGKKVPADKEVVEDYGKRLAGLKLGELVSENPKKAEELGFGPEKTVIEGNMKRLEVGKVAAGWDGTLVREENGDKVYKVKTMLEGQEMEKGDFWKQKYLTNLSKYQIKKIIVEKDGKKWDGEKLVDKISFLAAGEYLPDYQQGGVVYRLTVETENGKITVVTGKKTLSWNKFQYWATADEKDYFEVTKEDFEVLTGKWR